jgi:hypothetical protein
MRVFASCGRAVGGDQGAAADGVGERRQDRAWRAERPSISEDPAPTVEVR